MSKLLIVESPTKARTIGRMLGPGYRIIASMGHVRDLPGDRLGIDIAHDFAPEYVDTPRSRGVLKSLREAIRDADEVYLASDPDREGEAIAWHLAELLRGNGKVPFYRISFHEITKSAIAAAMAAKGEINHDLVDAQQARRVLDRLVGYQVSPLLWRRLEKGSSAGRVQSVALRLGVGRAREILAFVPEEFWNFAASFSAPEGAFTTKLFKIDGGDFRIADAAGAEAVEKAIRGGAAPEVAEVKRQPRRRAPYPPFTTSTMQQAANINLRFSASSTMRYAQQLYEGIELGSSGAVGLITYMRTDSVTIAREAQRQAEEFIRGTYGAEFVPEHPNVYRNKAAAQEAHEAIRPTDVRRTPESLAPYLDPQQLKLYTLIWKRFVASQMAAARLDQTSVSVAVEGSDRRRYDFHAVATVTLFPGFTRLYDDDPEKESGAAAAARIFQSLTPGARLSLTDLESSRKFTEPPPRYSEAALIKELESNNIGRPSTYATILKTIQERGYVKREQGKLHPTELGFTVWDFLHEKLPALFEIGFTADMERELDEIEEGKLGWTKMMHNFYDRFRPWLAAAKEEERPPADRASALLELLRGVEFAPPRKVGRRVYDDRKFLTSVEEVFQRSGKISSKQYQALLSVAARCADRLDPDRVKALDAEVRAAIDTARREQLEREDRRESAAAAQSGYGEVFDAFDGVEFSPPTTRGKVTYDDRKFFQSLRRQAEGGRPLSEKQQAALAKLARRYLTSLKNPDRVCEVLGLGAATAPEAAPEKAAKQAEAPAASADEVAAMLARLAGVSKWEAPAKRGRFAFDEHKFYLSLDKQHREGRALSPKQIAVLKRLDAKYKERVTDHE